jgi:hypothetical protein
MLPEMAKSGHNGVRNVGQSVVADEIIAGVSASFLAGVSASFLAGVSASFLLAHLSVPIGRMAEDRDAPRFRGVPLAPATPFEELGPLVFGHNPWDLE